MDKKKLWIRIGVLAAVFAVAVFIISLITNRGAADRTVDIGEATLPRIAFDVEGHTVNVLAGYTEEMDITAMRNTITPLGSNGNLTMNIEKNDNKIDEILYEVCSLDGKESYGNGTLGEKDSKTDLSLGKLLGEQEEAVLKITLQTGENGVHYYTRITNSEERSTGQCLSFAKTFQDNTFDKARSKDVSTYLESNEEGDNTTYRTVTLYSDVTHVMWGGLNPEISGEVEWSLKESNSVYTSLLARYKVTCKGEKGEAETYNVKEFFRIRVNQGEVFLLDYSRSMNEIFAGGKDDLSDKGIVLGVASPDVSYMTNENGTIVSFVQERDLWTYNEEADELSLVFSFANTEGADVRSWYDQHEVRIIGMEKNGSTTFSVCGYMNRGKHEGQVGVGVYYFDIEKNAVQEKAFIPSRESFAIAQDELGKMVYYSQEQQQLYVMAGGTLHKINLEENEQSVLVEGLQEGQYVASADGHMLAYQAAGDEEAASRIQVLDLKSGKEQMVEAGNGENIHPLGFVFHDFLYGVTRKEDQGMTAAGEALQPMYKLEIRDKKNTVIKTYEVEGVYVEDVVIENSMITLNRVVKSGEIYTQSSRDYVTNNEEGKESNIMLETFSVNPKQKQVRLTYVEGIADKAPKILKPKMVTEDESITIAFEKQEKSKRFYVFGNGEMEGIYSKAGYAIQRAEQVSGVVVSSEQSYVWEKGNRSLVYEIELEPFRVAEGQSTLAACEEQMKEYAADRVDLTGCTLEQIFYVMNKGCPVIAMLDANNAVLLTGYTQSSVTYINPATGERLTAAPEEVSQMTAGSGGVYIGYIQ